MAAPALHCHRCQTPLPVEPGALQAVESCPLCEAGLRVTLFPAWTRPPEAAVEAQPILESGEAACFFHPQKRAAVPCDRCGRFLCALCDFPLEGRHLCAGCVESGAKQNEIGALERNRVRWDQVVWYLLVGPLLVGFWPAPLCAPAALVIALVKLKSPPSLVSRSRMSLIAGIVVALAEIGGMIAIGWSIAQG